MRMQKTIENLLKEYKEHLKLKAHTKSVITLSIANLRHVLRRTDKDIKNITKKDMEKIIRKDMKTGISIKRIQSKIDTMKSFYMWLEKMGIVLLNPIKDIERPKSEGLKLKEVLGETEIKMILDKTQTKKEKAILELMYSTGLRLQEIHNLNIQDIDLKNRIVYVKQGKGKKDRLVPIGKVAVKAVEEYLKVRQRKINIKALFTVQSAYCVQKMGKRNIRKVIKKAGERIGIKVLPHTIRRSFATHMINAGCGIMNLKDMLGHSKVSTLNHYVKLSHKSMKKEHGRRHPRG